MIDLNQAIQPVILGQLAGQGKHQISLEGIKRGAAKVGDKVGNLPRIRGTKIGQLLRSGQDTIRKNDALAKVKESMAAAQDKLEASLVPKKINQLNQQMRKEFGKDWRKNGDAIDRFHEELGDLNDYIRDAATTYVHADANGAYNTPQALQAYAEALGTAGVDNFGRQAGGIDKNELTTAVLQHEGIQEGAAAIKKDLTGGLE